MNQLFSQFSISAEIQRALTELSYKKPTAVQQAVIPDALLRKDLIVKSQTGSGKTASFAIPLVELTDWEENKPQALVLTPTRELAAQVKEDITNIGRFKRTKATAIYGKSPFARQKLELKQKTHIVVGTPGRVLDHIEKETLDVQKIQYLVIDEADEMLNMGFIEQVSAIIERLPSERVTMLFSATFPADIVHLADTYMNDPKRIDVTKEAAAPAITHEVIAVAEEQKMDVTRQVLTVESPESAILFCRTQERVETLFDALDGAGISSGMLHGGMVQEDRFDVMNKFKRGDFRYLCATDVAARGIDVEDIPLVIHFDVPLEKESYVHRTGRTGRAGQSGKAIALMSPFEKKFVNEIEEFVGFELQQINAPSPSKVKAAKALFDAKMSVRPEPKKDKGEQLNKDIMKLYFNGGKKKKLRAVDFVGTISNLPGIEAADIGIITIQDNVTYVEILNGKGAAVLRAMKTTTVKGKQLKVQKARN
ncbi:DEAD/DEAH box helicase [Domibacillus enclensis]|uniref:ATP-dependent RNA helicase DbpA n=1 Tax=Domibacillus enclensis TaxID=1017273 RepID=A0A1N6NW73_9BACI|nr:DEAD/DEAH box helicase [Domibacillus enclensis]OXS80160.1 RNA helicase [Domibacillus enclensis]SIP96212.1 ATP-dependent RNA helicase DbpA [Domibacillus enclensis]